MATSSNQPLDHLTNPSNPYFLHPNKNHALVIISSLLSRPNYHSWARAITMTLQSKNKVKFIDEILPKPASTNSMLPV